MSKKLFLLLSVLVLGLASNTWAQLPANQDVGNPALGGSLVYDPVADTWTIQGAGADVWGSSDQFHYVFRPLAGNGVGIVRVVSMDITHEWQKVGVMIRETLDANSKHMAVAMTGSHGAQTLWRQDTGGGSASLELAGVALPLYLKVERVGDTLSTSVTWDPAFWIPQQTLNIPMNATVYIGMFVCSVNSGALCTAVFDKVDLTAPVYKLAWNLSPANGSQDLPLDTVLSWMPGDTAASHDVCLGTSSPAPFVVNQAATTYAPVLQGGTTYYYRIDEVEADGVTKHTGQELSFTTLAPGPGKAKYEYWAGIGGVAVADLTGNPAYPDSPSGTQYVSNFEGPADWADNYGCRLSGWLHPPVSGDYTLWVASDDASELWLSTSASPADAVKIAGVDTWTGSRAWDSLASQKSAPVSLVAGQIYYIEALMKEGGGGDNLSVAWQIPGQERALLTGAYVGAAPDRPLKAYAPLPADGSQMMPVDTTVSWLAGATAASHDVYFGTSSPPAFVGNQAGLGYNPGLLAGGTVYYWKVDEVEADGTTKHAGDIWSFKTTRPCVGTIAREVWEGIGGTVVSDLTNNANYPDNPSWSDEITSFNVDDFADNYGSRIHGWLFPETSGDYTFWIASDDSSGLWLSTDEDPANAVRIAYVDGWTANRAWDWQANQKSAPVSLTGGKMYYIMALYKEGGGGDNCSVAWEGPDSPTQGVIGGYYLRAHILAYNPSPKSGATVLGLSQTLCWSPVCDAVSYDVYLDGVLLTNTTQTCVDVGPFELGSTHTWRVDVVADSGVVRKGTTWSFTIADYLVIDDFSSYDMVPEGTAPQFIVVDVPPEAPDSQTAGVITATAPSDAGLLAHYTFADGAKDSSGNGRDGTLVGGATVADGVLTLNGTDACVNIGNDAVFNPAGSFSIAARVKMTAWGANWANIIAGKRGEDNVGWQLRRRSSNNQLCFTLRGTSGDDDPRGLITPVLDTWLNIVAVFDAEADLRTVYINGAVDVQLRDIGTVTPCNHNVYIGARAKGDNTGPEGFFNGQIDDLAIYSRALSLGEVRYLAGLGDLDVYSPLRLHAKLDGDLTDSSGNGNNGTMVGGDPVFATGVIGQGIHFDGVDDYVQFGDVGISGPAPRTVAAWAKADVLASAMTDWTNIFGFTGRGIANRFFDLEIVNAGGRRAYGLHVYGWERIIMPVDLEWHHLAASYDGATIKWYGDGKRLGTDSSRVLETYDNVHMGKRFDNSVYWKGSVDDARVYDYALSEGEVAYLVGVGGMDVAPIYGPMRLHAELDGDLTDSSGNGVDGTAIGGDPQYVAGVAGSALDLDGTDDYIDFGIPQVWPTDRSARSMCAWAKSDSVDGGWRWIAAYGRAGTGEAMFIGMNGADLYGGGYGDDMLVAGFWDVGTWHHICLTYDGTTARLYADGKLRVTQAKNWNLVMTRAHIGRQVNDAAEFWNGLVDDVRIYDYALTPAQVAGLAGAVPANPIADTWSDWGLVDFSLDSGAMRVDTYGWPGLRYYIGEVSRVSPFADLTAGGGKALSIMFRGDPANVARAMYVALTDSDGVNDYVLYDGDTANLANAEWQTWNVDMRGFQGVNLANVNEIGIGLAGLDGGIKADTMRFDDIRVYTGRCIPSLIQPKADLNNDCRVDIADVEIIADNWGAMTPTCTVVGDGADIWGNADAFHYMYQELSGNGEIIARVTNVGTGSSTWAKAGVMIRETLNADSKHMIMALTSGDGGGIAFQGRPETAGGSISFHGDITAAPPTWVKLTRVGNTITAYYSADGVNWTLFTDASPDGAMTNPIDVVMADPVKIGLFMTSHAAGELRTAKFDHVSINGDTAPVLTGADIATTGGSSQCAVIPTPADLNNDNKVGWADVFILLDEWLVETLWPY
jgi:regulation of enolase protein 1 (concanavalin A-like superfamily)